MFLYVHSLQNNYINFKTGRKSFLHVVLKSAHDMVSNSYFSYSAPPPLIKKCKKMQEGKNKSI